MPQSIPAPIGMPASLKPMSRAIQYMGRCKKTPRVTIAHPNQKASALRLWAKIMKEFRHRRAFVQDVCQRDLEEPVAEQAPARLAHLWVWGCAGRVTRLRLPGWNTRDLG